MTNLFCDIGYKSINHFGEQLCGDHVVIKRSEENGTVIVLADGLGSGVKASILSTLTSTIISTMLAEGLSVTDCVDTIVATLPVCADREVAYSTFTIIHIKDTTADIIQYDNPPLVLLRNGKNYSYITRQVKVNDKKLLLSNIQLKEHDTLVAFSDGCPYAGPAHTLNMNWKQEDIVSFLETYSAVGYSAKTLATMLVDECNRLYNNAPGDDTTALAVHIKKRQSVNIFFGPPLKQEMEQEIFDEFFALPGKHVICGGTTARIAAAHLKKTVIPENSSPDPTIPPISKIEGVDLTTEGVVTMSKVLEYAKDYLNDNELYTDWAFMRDGASLLARLLFETATDITFYAGQAINEAHNEHNSKFSYERKALVLVELSDLLKAIGKDITIKTV